MKTMMAMVLLVLTACGGGGDDYEPEVAAMEQPADVPAVREQTPRCTIDHRGTVCL